MTDLNALMIFAKVVEAKSFSEAARRLAMPVSTVSRRVADLDIELGARLLVRSTRNVRLTEAGSEVIQHARKSAEVSDAVDRLMASKRMDVAAMLRLSAPPSISDSLLAPLVAAFRLSFPDIRVKVFISGRISDDMAEGVDLEVKSGPRRDTALVAHGRMIFEDEILAASLDHALWFHRPFRADEWLLYDQDSPNTSGSRGLARGLIFDRKGKLCATVMQEGLIRIRDKRLGA